MTKTTLKDLHIGQVVNHGGQRLEVLGRHPGFTREAESWIAVWVRGAYGAQIMSGPADATYETED